MASLSVATIILFLSIVAVELNCSLASQVHVVYMGKATKSGHEPGIDDDTLSHDHQMLASVHDGSLEKAQASHIYTYKEGFRGFAAKLTKEQASILAAMPGVVRVLPNLKRKLHTTHSWDFMGLHTNEGMEIPGYSTKDQENVIIGFIDTGIWPESPSFHDEGMSPVPSRWNGHCQVGDPSSNFTCNKKVIGARYYLSGYEAEEQKQKDYQVVEEEDADTDAIIESMSPRDTTGHGTHTASTAAGRYVKNMSYQGLGTGGGRGGAQMARIAVYKACWEMGCYDADLLAAFDDAIKDGVDIISVSLGPDPPQDDYFKDPISIGSFHALTKGILVISSTGNAGGYGMATNIAPWLLTVAAGSTDRDFASAVVLGDGTKILGDSLTRYNMSSSISTISASEANAAYFTPSQSSFCLDSSLNETKAKGKILVCRHSGSSSDSRVEKSEIVKRAGAAGMILIDETEYRVATPFVLPATSVNREVGDKIMSYLNTARRPKSIILPARTIMGSHAAPRVSAFSSRGPNSLTPDILKPDVAAPGLNILAAWSPAKDKHKQFNVLSGTSMACPHVTGIAALVKAVYPTWSPSAIKSAIMTTATIFDRKGNNVITDPEGTPANPFDFGSGFIEPTRILNPGLILDSSPLDYKSFLCSIGYDNKSLQIITGDSTGCIKPEPRASDLNYASITVPNLKGSYQVTRTVTNVGDPWSVYQVSVDALKGVNVTVSPKVLAFQSYGSSKNFTVYFQAADPYLQDYVFGSILWRGKKNAVRVPLVVKIQ
ncbi:Subtilisin-like protease sbt3.9 [Rhynchospora pubera]|uniref:Subtilisin-like protease sbt3.9 n=1 Tax=Rhynchospora pubera TaxID=906938 RepID=A0AAV8CSB4_9POAL|nr:Subtilisin-like protease sbt3.9 [Rhynchospora pubera]